MADAVEGSAERGLSERTAFDEAISPLAQGELVFPPPFDFATSSALARNIDRGRIAELLFAVDLKRNPDFRLALFVCSADQPDLPGREIVNTKVSGTHVLVNLLDYLTEQLLAQEEQGD